MANNALSLAFINESTPYWYERVPFVQQVSLAQGQTESIVPQTSGWNLNESPSTLVSIESVATARDPGLQIRVTWDNQTRTLYAASHPPALEPVPVRARARDALSVTALGSTLMPQPVVYEVSVFQLPLVWKVLLGYPITADEQRIALDLGLTTSPVLQNGQHPIPFSTVLERTFENRQIATPIAYDGPPVAFTQSLSVRLPVIQAQTNSIVVLRRAAIGIGADYGPSLTVDRDTQEGHLVLSLGSFSATRPVDLWIPARQQIRLTLSVTTPPPGQVPVRVEALQVSLSNILRIRMGILSEQGVVQVFQEEARQVAAAQGRTVTTQELDRAASNARSFYERVVAGVM